MSQQVNVYRELKFTDTGAKATFGTSGTPLIRTFDGAKALQIYTTCASTDTGTSYEPVKINTILTGAGQVGGRVAVHMETNVALGGWANAFKASVDCKTSGRATGLLSVINADLTMPASAPGAGTYAVYEANVQCPTSWTGTNGVAIFYINSSGSTKANFDTYGYLFDIRGVSSTSGGFWYDNTSNDVDEFIRVKTPGGDRFIGLSDSGTVWS